MSSIPVRRLKTFLKPQVTDCLQAIAHTFSPLLSCSGNGASEDIVVSSARAYISALNKLIGFGYESAPREKPAAQKVVAS